MTTSSCLPMGAKDLAAVTAVGTALSGAAALTGGFNNVTTGASDTAVTLPNMPGGGSVVVRNISATTCLVFPPVVTMQINQIAAGSSFSLAQNKSAIFYQVSTTRYISMLTA